MHLTYKARFYDGQSTKPQTVDISLDEKGLLIQYTDNNGLWKQDHWNKALIKETDFSSAIVTLRYGESFPYQQLEITDQDFIHQYKTEFNVGFVKRWLHFSSGWKLGLLFGGFVVTVVLSYFFVLPFAADHVARQFPKEYEISMGKEMYASVLADSKVDSAKTEAINHFFKQLHVQTEYPIRITVLKDSIVNAFAMPGGGIIVYDGILKDMKRPEALAALLSHEYSHVELKHVTRNLFRNLSGYLFISVLFSDVNGITAIVLQNAHSLRSLKYSRELEHEADANGLEILRKNHLGTKGMVELFEQLKKDDTLSVSEMWSTHPELDSRIEFAKNFTKEHTYSIQQNDSLTFYFNQLKGDTSW